MNTIIFLIRIKNLIKSFPNKKVKTFFSPKTDTSQKIRNIIDFESICKKYENIHNLANKLNEDFIKQKKTQAFIKGYCTHCHSFVNFKYDMFIDVGQILFRERLICPRCLFWNRTRGMLYVLKKMIGDRKDLKIYAYEQVTNFYSELKKIYGKNSVVIGSEFLDHNLKSGTIVNGIRHEDALNLSFEDNSLDFIISNDVFEHVSDIRKTFKEAYRVLKKDGYLLSTMPINTRNEKSLVRAKIENGEIVHLMEKEIHGNPLSEDGSLAFYTLGWDVIEMQKDVGFKDPYAIAIWDKKTGHIDYDPILIFASKK